MNKKMLLIALLVCASGPVFCGEGDNKRSAANFAPSMKDVAKDFLKRRAANQQSNSMDQEQLAPGMTWALQGGQLIQRPKTFLNLPPLASIGKSEPIVSAHLSPELLFSPQEVGARVGAAHREAQRIAQPTAEEAQQRGHLAGIEHRAMAGSTREQLESFGKSALGMLALLVIQQKGIQWWDKATTAIANALKSEEQKKKEAQNKLNSLFIEQALSQKPLSKLEQADMLLKKQELLNNLNPTSREQWRLYHEAEAKFADDMHRFFGIPKPATPAAA